MMQGNAGTQKCGCHKDITFSYQVLIHAQRGLFRQEFSGYQPLKLVIVQLPQKLLWFQPNGGLAANKIE